MRIQELCSFTDGSIGITNFKFEENHVTIFHLINHRIYFDETFNETVMFNTKDECDMFDTHIEVKRQKFEKTSNYDLS